MRGCTLKKRKVRLSVCFRECTSKQFLDRHTKTYVDQKTIKCTNARLWHGKDMAEQKSIACEKEILKSTMHICPCYQ